MTKNGVISKETFFCHQFFCQLSSCQLVIGPVSFSWSKQSRVSMLPEERANIQHDRL